MPDLDIVMYWCCESVIYDEQEIPSSTAGTYKVRWVKAPDEHDYSMWWHCYCKRFRYFHQCPHVEQAKKRHCGWDQFFNGGEPIKDENGERHCPRCNGPVTAQRYGV